MHAQFNSTLTAFQDLFNRSENTSSFDDEEDPASQLSLAESILIGVILSLIIVFSVAGNILVVVAILTDRNLRRTSNYFIISLAIADMLVAILVMTFAVANDILGYWIFGAVFCNIWMSSDVMCSTASILNLCAISLDRYIHIRNPLHYEQWVTSRRTLLAMAAVWILSALISFLPIHLGWHRMSRDVEPEPITPSDRFICLLDFNPLYAVLSSMVSFYVPCVVMLMIYVRLYQYARRHVRSIKRTWTAGGGMNNGGDTKHGQYKLSDHKAAMTLGVIMGVFLFCWMPFFTMNIIGAFKPVPVILYSIFTWLGYFNSMLNPVIYSIFNVEFREAFKRVLSYAKCCCQCKQFEFGRKPIRANGTASIAEYGALTTRRTSSASALVNERITCV